jgi:hypothetical protein
MGSRDLTDGVWVWPEGLAHYVEEHDVMLPDAFLHTMRANEWKMPPNIQRRLTEIRELWPDPMEGWDIEPWVTWAFQFRPWYAFW